MEENIGYLQRIELLAALVVSTLQQLLIELGASYYPSENRAGLTPAWCNFVNPFSYNVEFSHTDLTDLTDFDSFGVFLLSPNENTRCLQRKNKSARSVRSVCDLNTIRNHDT